MMKTSVFDVKNFTPKFGSEESTLEDQLIYLLLVHDTIIICQVDKEWNTNPTNFFKIINFMEKIYNIIHFIFW